MEAVQNEVEEVAVDDVAEAEAETEAAPQNPHKTMILAELMRWQKEIEGLAVLLHEASVDTEADYLYKSQCVVTALDKEAVYLTHMARVVEAKLKEQTDAKPTE